MGRHPDDRWDESDIHNRGENYEQNSMRLHELGLHLTLGANGQVIVIKHTVKRGVSETLYKWTGTQPQLPTRVTRH